MSFEVTTVLAADNLDNELVHRKLSLYIGQNENAAIGWKNQQTRCEDVEWKIWFGFDLSPSPLHTHIHRATPTPTHLHPHPNSCTQTPTQLQTPI